MSILGGYSQENMSSKLFHNSKVVSNARAKAYRGKRERDHRTASNDKQVHCACQRNK